MKKFIVAVLILVLGISSVGTSGYAKVGDVIGEALHTDIVVYINNFAIPSYAVNGQSVIVAEDLRNFGFDVVWEGADRSLTISKNENTEVSLMYVGKGYETGTKYTDILETDISVWANGTKLTSYAMNGYTMIPVEELTMFGEVNWEAEERALKMWVDNLAITESAQMVSRKYYPQTTVPDFGWFTETICVYWNDGYLGDTHRAYMASSEQLEDYVQYIKRLGWHLDANMQGADGWWYTGYINPKLRVGVAVAEYEGLVTVQIGTYMDYWQE